MLLRTRNGKGQSLSDPSASLTVVGLFSFGRFQTRLNLLCAFRLMTQDMSRRSAVNCSPPNKRAPGKGGIPPVLHAGRAWPALPEHYRSASRTMRTHTFSLF